MTRNLFVRLPELFSNDINKYEKHLDNDLTFKNIDNMQQLTCKNIKMTWLDMTEIWLYDLRLTMKRETWKISNKYDYRQFDY